MAAGFGISSENLPDRHVIHTRGFMSSINLLNFPVFREFRVNNR